MKKILTYLLPLLLSFSAYADGLSPIGGGSGGGGVGTVTSITPKAGITNTPGSAGTAITTSGNLYGQLLENPIANASCPYTVLATDAGELDTYNSSSACTSTIPQAGTTGFEQGVSYNFLNKGAGVVTICATTSTITGVSLTGSCAVLSQYCNLSCTSDSTGNYSCLGSGSSSSVSSTPYAIPANGATYTPNNTSKNFNIYLVHTTCAPCTIANPSATFASGQTGEFVVSQSATGSDTVSWGNKYVFSAATAPTLTATASRSDVFIYYVDASGNIIVGNQVPNVANLNIASTPVVVGTGCASTTTSGNNISCAITTSGTADLLIAYGKSTQALLGNITSISGGATTWVKRTSGSWGTGQGYDEWYGFTSAPLSTVTITATWNGNPSKLGVMALSSVNTTTPFDPSSSLPSIADSGASTVTTQSITGATTTKAGDLLVGSQFLTVGQAPTLPTNFSALVTPGSTSSNVSGLAVIPPQTGQTYTWTFGTTTAAFTLFEAIQGTSR